MVFELCRIDLGMQKHYNTRIQSAALHYNNYDPFISPTEIFATGKTYTLST